MPDNVYSCIAEPPFATAGKRGTWSIKYVLPRTIAVDEKVRLQIMGGRNNRAAFVDVQSEKPAENGYLSAFLDEDTRLSLTQLKLPGQHLDRGTFAVETGRIKLKKNSVLKFIIGDTRFGGGGALAKDQTHFNKYIVLYISDERFDNTVGWTEAWQNTVAEKPLEGLYWTESNHHQIFGYALMHLLGDEVDHLFAYAPSEVELNEEFRITVRPHDQYDNQAVSPMANLEVWLDDTKIDSPIEEIKNSTCVQQKVKITTEGIHRLLVKDPLRNIWAHTNPIRVVKTKSKLVPYWGMIHAHSELSDGICTLDHYFKQLRDGVGLDFGAPGDHDHFAETSDKMWKHTCQKVKAYNQPGRFVTFLGYEFAKWRRKGEGDRNVYYYEDDRPLYRSDFGHYPWPNDLFKAVKNEKCIIIPHHTACLGSFCDWEDHDPEHERLVEIYQVRGSYESSEAEGNPLAKKDVNPIGFVSNALKKGWRVGFTAGGDDHSSNVGADRQQQSSGNFCVYAEQLTRKGLWEGLWNRRVVATTGPRVLLDYTLNDYPMGSELDLKQAEDLRKNRILHIEYHGMAPVKSVDIIRNGKIIYSGNNLEMDFKLDYADTDSLETIALPPAKYCPDYFCYYYVRIIQNDMNMAWASPIWIDIKRGKAASRAKHSAK